MEKEGRAFNEVLEEAQRLGFAEADPSFDIDGVDAAHKLSILASLAFGTRLDFEGVAIDGIREVEAADIAYVETLGFKVRLVGIAQADANGLFQRSEEHTSELQSLMRISYAVFCLKKKKKKHYENLL